jgi:hypothetical protein
MLLAYDAHYYRPYPDAGRRGGRRHGVGGRPHLVANVGHEDFGHGRETVLVVSVDADPELLALFDKSLDEDVEMGGHWSGRADLALARRIRAIDPFAPCLTRVEQPADGPPRVTTRLDAATVAVAYARLLGTPLPASLELHGALRPRPALDDAPGRALGDGDLVVRFERGGGGPEEPRDAVTLIRRGDVRDLPDVLARIAALPLLPLALEGTGDRLAALVKSCEAVTEHPLGPGGPPDHAGRFRAAERHLDPAFTPNAAQDVAGYASLLFAAEPGLWRPCPDGCAPAAGPDVLVAFEALPGTGAGDSGRLPSRPSTLMRVRPAARHLPAVAAADAFHGHARTLAEWGQALGALKVDWIRFEPATCGLEADFEGTYAAAVFARHAGIPLPDRTPYGPFERAAYDWPGRRPVPPEWEPEALLAPAELALQRRAQAQIAGSVG